jgi:hypothetical protein
MSTMQANTHGSQNGYAGRRKLDGGTIKHTNAAKSFSRHDPLQNQ